MAAHAQMDVGSLDDVIRAERAIILHVTSIPGCQLQSFIGIVQLLNDLELELTDQVCGLDLEGELTSTPPTRSTGGRQDKRGFRGGAGRTRREWQQQERERERGALPTYHQIQPRFWCLNQNLTPHLDGPS